MPNTYTSGDPAASSTSAGHGQPSSLCTFMQQRLPASLLKPAMAAGDGGGCMGSGCSSSVKGGPATAALSQGRVPMAAEGGPVPILQAAQTGQAEMTQATPSQQQQAPVTCLTQAAGAISMSGPPLGTVAVAEGGGAGHDGVSGAPQRAQQPDSIHRAHFAAHTQHGPPGQPGRCGTSNGNAQINNSAGAVCGAGAGADAGAGDDGTAGQGFGPPSEEEGEDEDGMKLVLAEVKQEEEAPGAQEAACRPDQVGSLHICACACSCVHAAVCMRARLCHRPHNKRAYCGVWPALHGATDRSCNPVLQPTSGMCPNAHACMQAPPAYVGPRPLSRLNTPTMPAADVRTFFPHWDGISKLPLRVSVQVDGHMHMYMRTQEPAWLQPSSGSSAPRAAPCKVCRLPLGRSQPTLHGLYVVGWQLVADDVSPHGRVQHRASAEAGADAPPHVMLIASRWPPAAAESGSGQAPPGVSSSPPPAHAGPGVHLQVPPVEEDEEPPASGPSSEPPAAAGPAAFACAATPAMMAAGACTVEQAPAAGASGNEPAAPITSTSTPGQHAAPQPAAATTLAAGVVASAGRAAGVDPPDREAPSMPGSGMPKAAARLHTPRSYKGPVPSSTASVYKATRTPQILAQQMQQLWPSLKLPLAAPLGPFSVAVEVDGALAEGVTARDAFIKRTSCGCYTVTGAPLVRRRQGREHEPLFLRGWRLGETEAPADELSDEAAVLQAAPPQADPQLVMVFSTTEAKRLGLHPRTAMRGSGDGGGVDAGGSMQAAAMPGDGGGGGWRAASKMQLRQVPVPTAKAAEACTHAHTDDDALAPSRQRRPAPPSQRQAHGMRAGDMVGPYRFAPKILPSQVLELFPQAKLPLSAPLGPFSTVAELDGELLAGHTASGCFVMPYAFAHGGRWGYTVAGADALHSVINEAHAGGGQLFMRGWLHAEVASALQAGPQLTMVFSTADRTRLPLRAEQDERSQPDAAHAAAHASGLTSAQQHQRGSPSQHMHACSALDAGDDDGAAAAAAAGAANAAASDDAACGTSRHAPAAGRGAAHQEQAGKRQRTVEPVGSVGCMLGCMLSQNAPMGARVCETRFAGC